MLSNSEEAVGGEVVEIARFRVDAASEAGLLRAWAPMVDAMKRAHPALDSVRLVRFEDGTWADIAVWSDRRAADRACALDPSPEVAEFFDHIAEDISMELTEVVRER
jgi:hypothetical protein